MPAIGQGSGKSAAGEEQSHRTVKVRAHTRRIKNRPPKTPVPSKTDLSLAQERQYKSQAHAVRVEGNRQRRVMGSSPSGDRPQNRAREMTSPEVQAGVKATRQRVLAKKGRGSGSRAVKQALSGKGPIVAANQKAAKALAPDVARHASLLADVPGVGKYIRRGAEDLLNLPAQAVPSVYVPAAGVKEAAQGRPQRLKGFVKDVKRTDPYYNAAAAGVEAVKGNEKAAKAHLHRAVESVKEHPGFAAVEGYGLKGALGRGAGRVARAGAAGKAAKKAASTERAPKTLPGTSLREQRTYSPDVGRKVEQVNREQRQRRESQQTAERAKTEQSPERQAELQQKARAQNPDLIRERDIVRRVDKAVAAAEVVRRRHRAKTVEAARRELKPVRKAGPVTSLVTQRIARADVADLRAYMRELEQEHPKLGLAGKRANETLRHHLGKAIARAEKGKLDLAEVQRVADQYARGSAEGQRGLVSRGMLDEEQARRRAVMPYAIRKMGAEHVAQYKEGQRFPDRGLKIPNREAERKVVTTKKVKETTTEPFDTATLKAIARHNRKAGRPVVVRQPRDTSTYDPTSAGINRRQWFHGTAAEGLTKDTLDSTVTKPDNLFGQGVYMTTDRNIAGGYARNRAGGNIYGHAPKKKQRVYGAQVKVKNPLDLEQPYNKGSAQVFHSVLNKTAKGLGAMADHSDPDPFIIDEMRKAIEDGKVKTASDLYDVFRDAVSEMAQDYGWSRGDVTEHFADLAGNLRKAGFDALTHVGGKRTGHAPHQVVIVLDPADMTLHGQPNPVRHFGESRPVARTSKSTRSEVSPEPRKVTRFVTKKTTRTERYDPQAELAAAQRDLQTARDEYAAAKAEPDAAYREARLNDLNKAKERFAAAQANAHRELPTAEIEAHMRKHGQEPGAYISQAPNARGAGNFYRSSHQPPKISSQRFTGKATRTGTFSAHPETLVEARARTQSLTDQFDNFQRFLKEFAHKNPKGRGGYLTRRSKAQADQLAADLTEAHGIKWRPVRVNPFGASKEQLQAMLEGDTSHPNLTTDAIQEALDGKGTEGPWAVVPEAAARRMQEHVRLMAPGNAGRVARKASGLFRASVLSTSPKWFINNAVEAGFRSAFARAGIRSYITGKRVLKRLEQQNPAEAEFAKARTVGGGHYAMAERQQIHTNIGQFTDGAIKDTARKLGAFWEAPGAKQAAQLWHGWTHFVFNTANAYVEHQFQTAMLGKAVRDQLMPDKVMKLSEKAVDEAARGLTDTNTQVALGDAVDRMYGRYDKFRPAEKQMIALYTPFIAWALNAAYFVTRTLPQDHPTALAVLAATERATDEWRKMHGLDEFMKGRVPGFLQGSIPASNDVKYRAPTNSLPFAAFTDLPSTAAGAVLPQASSLLDAFQGRDWKGNELRDAHGQPLDELAKARVGAGEFLQSTIPVLAAKQQIEKGIKGQAKSITGYTKPKASSRSSTTGASGPVVRRVRLGAGGSGQRVRLGAAPSGVRIRLGR